MHITREMLQALLEGRLAPQELVALVRDHLLDLCPVCRVEYDEHRRTLRGRPSPENLALALDQVAARLPGVEGERKKAMKWLEEMRSLPHEERLARLERARSRFRGPAFVVLLLAETRSYFTRDAPTALEWATLAQAAAIRAPVDPELFVRSLAYAGNAHRACGGFEQAARMLGLARQQLDRQHVTDPGVAAEVDSFLGSLYTNLRRLDDAENVLLRALMFCRLAQDAEAAARVLIQLSLVYDFMGHPSTAAETVQQALSLLGPGSNEQLYLMARFNLARYLHAAGRSDEAREMLTWDSDLYAERADAWTRLRVQWLEGRILMDRDDLAKAERLLTGVRAGFLETSPYDVAAVSIDLALLYHRQHRHRDLREAVSHALNVLIAHQNVHRDALAAIQLLHQAAAEERLTAQLIVETATALQRSRGAGQADGVVH